MATVHAQLVSPERILWEGEAEMVVVSTTSGEVAFLPGHQPFLGLLDTGIARFLLVGGEEVAAAVHGGFVEVGNDVVRVLSDVAELAGEVDIERARNAEERARDALMRRDDDEAIAALARASVRIQAHQLMGQLSAP